MPLPPLKPLTPLAPIARHEPQPPTQPQPVRTAAPLVSKAQPLADDAFEDDPYDVAGRELQTGDKHPGTWARATVEADGEHSKTEAAYVRLRVAGLEAQSAKRKADREARRAEERLASEPNQAQLRAAALAAMQNSVGSAHDSLPEVTAFATVIGFPNADALALLRHDILQQGTGWRFKGKFYADLAGALKATRL